MNIWFVHHYAMPPSLSGITKHFMLAKELQKLGHSTAIIAANINHKNKGVPLPQNTNHLHKTYDDIPFLWLKTLSNSGGYIKRVSNMFTFFWRLMRKTGFSTLQKPDIIIGCSPEPFAALAALLIAKQYKIPFALHMGDLWPSSLIDLGNISKYHPFMLLVGAVEKYLYKHADKIITPLPTIEKHVESNGGNPNNIVWLQNGVDIDALPTYKEPIASSPFKIYFAGSHGPANGLDTVLDAAALTIQNNKDIEFYLIGDGPEKSRLQQRMKNEKIINIHFLNPVPKKEIYIELQKANAFIINYPDLNVFKEGGISPNKIYDYMGVGRPTIVGCSAPQNPVKIANAGITVAASDAKAIADAAIKLQKMPADECQKMGKNGYDYILKNNTYTQIGKQLENVLLELVQEK